jgi:hypothetical protein
VISPESSGIGFLYSTHYTYWIYRHVSVMDITFSPLADLVQCCVEIIKHIADRFSLFLVEEKYVRSSGVCFLYGVDQLFSFSIFILIYCITKLYGGCVNFFSTPRNDIDWAINIIKFLNDALFGRA